MNLEKEIKFSKTIKKLFKIFEENNKELYLVGGAVRDMLLGKTPKDFDFSTNALTEEVEKMFETTIPTGIEYGTITVVLDGEDFEITTYRKDHDYDGRRPKAITFSETIEEDLKRRDFTINAMAMNSEGKIIDLFGGRRDLKSKTVSFVGEGVKRVLEDKLRLIRGIRFSTLYNFQIPNEEYSQIYMAATEIGIEKISVERFTKEFKRILTSENVAKGLLMLKETKILEVFIPEIKATYNFNQHNSHHFEDVFRHTISVVGKSKEQLNIRMAALLHDIGKPKTFEMGEDKVGHFFGHELESSKMAKTILKRLRFPNKFIGEVCFLIENHMYKEFPQKGKSIRRFIKKMETKEKFEDLMELIKVDTIACCDMKEKVEFEKELNNFKQAVYEEMDKDPIVNTKQLVINGNDLMNILKIPQGKEIGKILKELTNIVIERQNLNRKIILLGLAQEMHEKNLEKKNNIYLVK